MKELSNPRNFLKDGQWYALSVVPTANPSAKRLQGIARLRAIGRKQQQWELVEPMGEPLKARKSLAFATAPSGSPRECLVSVSAEGTSAILGSARWPEVWEFVSLGKELDDEFAKLLVSSVDLLHNAPRL